MSEREPIFARRGFVVSNAVPPALYEGLGAIEKLDLFLVAAGGEATLALYDDERASWVPIDNEIPLRAGRFYSFPGLRQVIGAVSAFRLTGLAGPQTIDAIAWLYNEAEYALPATVS